MRIHRTLAALVFVAASPVALRAQVADTSVALTVALDHADWLYRVGDTARYRIGLTRAGKPVPNARVRVVFAQERLKPMRTDTIDVSNGERTLSATLPVPGFVRATATAVVDGRTYTGLGTAGFSPELITAAATAPADLMSFWEKAIADARRTPLAPMMTRLPQYSTPDVDAYHVSFQNNRANSRIYGMLAVPTKPGKYPAMLVVPGAGVRPYFPSIAMAKKGIIHLTIGIHGIPVDRDSLIYNELRATALASYWAYGVEDRDLYYYKRVYVGVVRAGDFIFSLPQFDGTNYVVQGGSQGGGLSLVAGVLDPRVKAIGVTHPAMADHFGYLKGQPGGWPHIFQDTAGMRALPQKMETLRYYDAVNFARLLKVPSIFTWGFNDNTVPPTASYAAYNVITAPKEMFLAPATGHFREPWQVQRMDKWLLEKLGVTTP
jgi:cephalosporin-C deacetylase-like acetyl esterase